MESTRITSTNPPPSDLSHRLVLEYLRLSGRTKAARCFEKEAEISVSKKGEESLKRRGEIRRKILSGDIIGALMLINDLNYELLDTNEDLVFRLKLQAFIEMVRVPGYDLEQALAFASEEFVPCPTHLLHNLEEAMALLAFENPAESPLKEVLNRREKIATEVNNAILASECATSPQLVRVLKSALWMDHYCGTPPLYNKSQKSDDHSMDPPLNEESSAAFFSQFL